MLSSLTLQTLVNAFDTVNIEDDGGAKMVNLKFTCITDMSVCNTVAMFCMQLTKAAVAELSVVN